MNKKKCTAMTIAGSDSGGGAGIQADLRAFSFFGCFGTSAITAVTAQNPHKVTAVQGIEPQIVRQQIETALEAIDVGAVKTGMLFNAETIDAVTNALQNWKLPLIVDPVMVATSGAKLLQDDAVNILQRRLLPLATVITPNIPEAEVLTGTKLTDVLDMQKAALQLSTSFGATVIVKGGHSTGESAVDVICDGKTIWHMCAPRLERATTHGSGCALSAAIAACIASDDDVLTALQKAKSYVHECIAHAVKIGASAFALQPPDRLSMKAVVLERVLS